MIGLIANGVFGANYIIGLDGVNADPVLYPGGWIQHNWKQLYIQFAYVVACSAYAFAISALIAFVINFVPGLKLRASDESELLGMDDSELGEFAYDYVEVRRDYLAWTPATNDPINTNGDVPAGDRHGIAAHSDMLNGKEEASSDGGADHTHSHTHTHTGAEHIGIGGDRHGIASKQG
jgi:Amt family ammonium transporter